MDKNKISVTSENIFPIIKKFLYSNQEIFLRELVSNAVDSITKLKTISNISKVEDIVNNLKINVFIDNEKKEIHIIDNGIGMNEKEIKKYINQIAFSGAEEFIQKHKETSSEIIGNFGLGFYSSFMVSDKVMIFSQSYKPEYPSIFWSCDGTPKFFMKEVEKRNRGTEIILCIGEKYKEFLEYDRILKILKKYCRFMPVEIYISSKKEKEFLVNNPFPLWKKNPSQLREGKYLTFYKELYPHKENPLFWVHLNIDHPFSLQGILFFPKLERKFDFQKEKIHLYQNQVYITDNLEGIVPEFLSFLIGVIDSPNIPLNVSRSHLQSDNSIINISKYIVRKVSDKLNFIFTNDRVDFQKKWKDIKMIVEYGMITTQHFFDKAINFYLFQTVDKIFYTFDEFKNQIIEKHKDKYGKMIVLYASNINEQYSYIQSAKNKTYEVLLLDSPLSVHLIQKFEMSFKDLSFVRIDSDHIDKLILKDKKIQLPSIISEMDQKRLISFIKKYSIENINFHNIDIIEHLSEKEDPFLIVVPEFLRRIKEMNDFSTKNNISDNDLDKNYQLIVNPNHLIVKKILQEILPEEKRIKILQNALKLTLLSKNLLKGKNLSSFVSEKFKELVNH
ncbi:molecular chaperone HtpG [Blattabacterium cuenoti]|uniref:molecular chaperone HtpG n=1 Tax=Blattabacterium cuenoti TaxID=1653831 RepID=UPI00163B6BD1|nr:molecular chaperone HtpG [Blattabacterium cuenoti]